MRIRIFIYGRVLVAAVAVLFFPGTVLKLDLKLLLFPSLLISYFLLIWFLAGRDPKPGPVVTRYSPPDGMSPAEVRYLVTGVSDRKTVAAVLAHLAAQNVIGLEPETGGYRITLLCDKPPAHLPPEEASAFDALAQIQSLEIPGRPKNPPRTLFLRSAKAQELYLVASIVAGSLMRRVGPLYFKRNLRYSIPAAALSILAAIVMAAYVGRGGEVVFLTLWFLLFSLVVGMIFATNAVSTIRDAFRGMLSARSIAFTFAPPPVLLVILGLVVTRIARAANATFALTLVALLVVNVGGSLLIQTKTALARQRLDQIAGFRQFLASVELDRLDRMNNPQLTPALLNDHLAYAIALDLKEGWGGRLSDALLMSANVQLL